MTKTNKKTAIESIREVSKNTTGNLVYCYDLVRSGACTKEDILMLIMTKQVEARIDNPRDLKEIELTPCLGVINGSKCYAIFIRPL